ncbi:carcinoembryonic antigen-related cell adhesion molecule 5-like [Cynocephalus volans]|uniref:carcinoembryonic antigen-related cell adhesion molecule 5-like n=1 Tax=Cynocephalus volans TaxID=110931 RepID=UPI002FCC6E1A
MEFSSDSPCKGHIPWQWLLLTVSLLNFWIPPRTAQLTIESVPFNAAEGQDVLLLVHNMTESLQAYHWYKGQGVLKNQLIISHISNTQVNISGPAYSSREILFPNGSLLFQNVTLEDTGYYTLQTIDINFSTDQASGQFHVYSELPKPSVTSNNSHPVEDKDSVALTCEPETQDTTYAWWVNGQSLQLSSRLDLSLDNRTLTLLSVMRNDTGPYECGTQNPVSTGRSDPVTLNISYGPDTPTISSPDSSYRTGANLSLFCYAASNPPAQYSWLINGRPQQSTQELIIPNITVNDSGSYTCLAYNSATGLNRTTVKTITVYAELPKPSITSNNSHPVEDEDPVALTCEPETQDTTYVWWINGQRLQVSPRLDLSLDNRTLTLLSVTRNDTGPYECETQNPVSTSRSDAFTLNISYGPDTPTISSPDSSYRTGANLSLFCYSASNPPAQYSWLINGRPQQSTQELIIPNITVNDSGSYTCLAYNSATGLNRTTVKTITVYAELPKPSITSNNSHPVEDEDPVALTCEPETQDTTYVWWINGQRLQVSPRLDLSLDNRTLTLLSVTRNDTGPYECETQNPVSTSRSDAFTLNISYGPDTPTISSPDSSYRTGANLSLFCYAASNPPAQYLWLINGRSHQSTQELIIPNITVNDSGSYTCLAYNSATGLNRTTVKTITVYAELPKPSITSNNSHPVEDEDSVALTCEPETQDTTYVWWINGQRLQVSPRLDLSLDNRTLTLLSVTRNDAGPYECETQNPVSTSRSDAFTLNISYGLDNPTISFPDSSCSTGANLSLFCYSASNPPTQFSWLINGRPQQSTQELFIPNITVSDSGSYTCLACNSATGLNRTTVKTITVSDKPVTGSSPGISAGLLVGIVIGVAGVALT